jgi:hypothetical protein
VETTAAQFLPGATIRRSRDIVTHAGVVLFFLSLSGVG